MIALRYILWRFGFVDTSPVSSRRFNIMKYWIVFFFVLASFRSDDGEVAHIVETGHWCSHELHRDAMNTIERFFEF